ncbi:MAG: hypothetical protein ABIM89_15585, partial [Mycobacteriales bacterium]
PTATPSASPSATPSDTASPSPTEAAPEPSGSPSSGVPNGRLGANFVAVFEADESRQLGLFAKATGKLVNDLGVTVGPGDVQPQATPDGAYIYFLHHSGDACESGLYRVPTAGGGAERLVDPQQQVEAFALNGDGTRVIAVRQNDCGTPKAKRVLTEYDAATGDVVADHAITAAADTAVTALAWHPAKDLIAAVRTGRGATYSVETFELSAGGTTKPAPVQELPNCLGRIRIVRFATDALYIARDCMNPENAEKAGNISRDPLAEGPLLTETTDPGTAVAGMYVDAATENLVFATVRWLEEDDEGPTTVYSVHSGTPEKLFGIPQKLTELVW